MHRVHRIALSAGQRGDCRAERLEDLGAPEARSAYLEVSLLEEKIAELLPASDPEGAVARNGAVEAARAAGECARAEELAARYAAEDPRSLE